MDTCGRFKIINTERLYILVHKSQNDYQILAVNFLLLLTSFSQECVLGVRSIRNKSIIPSKLQGDKIHKVFCDGCVEILFGRLLLLSPVMVQKYRC